MKFVEKELVLTQVEINRGGIAVTGGRLRVGEFDECYSSSERRGHE